MEENTDKEPEENPLELGSAYLEYCVKRGWLVKKGEGESATYALTPDGEKKLAKVTFNFDLSALDKIEREPKRKYKRRR